MSASQSTLDVSLRGREYRVSCAPDERDALREAVAYVDAKMTELASKGGSNERLAVMTALNIAHELLLMKAGGGFDVGEFQRRIRTMELRLDEALAQQERLF